ncbi:MAG TPA: sugar kinase [Solirubrobacteraceae bacterium]|nr:sugar kinase [Solirubrobacteraceae bacterium]
MGEPSIPRLDATAIGEGQLRLDTAVGHPLRQASELSVTVAGAEGNVMGLLARLGNRTGLVTCLPRSSLGGKVADEYHAAGINTDAVIWRASGRVALYFVEKASPPVPSRVIFDRAGSCFADLTAADIDWGYVADSRLVHLTGITACLNDSLSAIVLRAARSGRAAGQLVSVDVNYRAQLASPAQARERLTPLLEAADAISCSRRDAKSVFGIDGEGSTVAQALSQRFGASTVLVSDGARPAVAFASGRNLSAQPPATAVVDRVGAGDALVAGFLHGYLQDDPERGLQLGVAAAALALTRYGDQLHTSLEELESLSSSLGTDIVR